MRRIPLLAAVLGAAALLSPPLAAATPAPVRPDPDACPWRPYYSTITFWAEPLYLREGAVAAPVIRFRGHGIPFTFPSIDAHPPEGELVAVGGHAETACRRLLFTIDDAADPMPRTARGRRRLLREIWSSDELGRDRYPRAVFHDGWIELLDPHHPQRGASVLLVPDVFPGQGGALIVRSAPTGGNARQRASSAMWARRMPRYVRSVRFRPDVIPPRPAAADAAALFAVGHAYGRADHARVVTRPVAGQFAESGLIEIVPASRSYYERDVDPLFGDVAEILVVGDRSWWRFPPEEQCWEPIGAGWADWRFDVWRPAGIGRWPVVAVTSTPDARTISVTGYPSYTSVAPDVWTMHVDPVTRRPLSETYSRSDYADEGLTEQSTYDYSTPVVPRTPPAASAICRRGTPVAAKARVGFLRGAPSGPAAMLRHRLRDRVLR